MTEIIPAAPETGPIAMGVWTMAMMDAIDRDGRVRMCERIADDRLGRLRDRKGPVLDRDGRVADREIHVADRDRRRLMRSTTRHQQTTTTRSCRFRGDHRR